MNKLQFLQQFRQAIKMMPKKEKDELLEDYETHFAFGQQAGKTEEEISLELGNPLELAHGALEDYQRNSSYTMKKSASTTRTIFAVIGLFSLNFILAIVPLGIAIWATWLSFIISAAAMIVSPALVFINYLITSQFVIGQFFAAIMISGIGILLGLAFIYVGKLLLKVTKSYYHWNIRVIKGGQ